MINFWFRSDRPKRSAQCPAISRVIWLLESRAGISSHSIILKGKMMLKKLELFPSKCLSALNFDFISWSPFRLFLTHTHTRSFCLLYSPYYFCILKLNLMKVVLITRNQYTRGPCCWCVCGSRRWCWWGVWIPCCCGFSRRTYHVIVVQRSCPRMI